MKTAWRAGRFSVARRKLFIGNQLVDSLDIELEPFVIHAEMTILIQFNTCLGLLETQSCAYRTGDSLVQGLKILTKFDAIGLCACGSVTRQQDIQTERLNQLGISPAGVTSELERVRGLLANDIRTTGGIERALTLEGGIGDLRQQGILSAQQALSPTLFDPALGALQTSLGVQNQGFQTVAQLATSSAQAEAARNAGISNAIGGGASSLLLSTLLGGGGGGGQLSSTSLQSGLGVEPPGAGLGGIGGGF